MSSKDNKNKGGNKSIPDSSVKKARGSKKVHSELDDSTKDGWQPNKGKEEE